VAIRVDHVFYPIEDGRIAIDRGLVLLEDYIADHPIYPNALLHGSLERLRLPKLHLSLGRGLQTHKGQKNEKE
jgi:hypothetical protein